MIHRVATTWRPIFLERRTKALVAWVQLEPDAGRQLRDKCLRFGCTVGVIAVVNKMVIFGILTG